MSEHRLTAFEEDFSKLDEAVDMYLKMAPHIEASIEWDTSPGFPDSYSVYPAALVDIHPYSPDLIFAQAAKEAGRPVHIRKTGPPVKGAILVTDEDEKDPKKLISTTVLFTEVTVRRNPYRNLMSGLGGLGLGSIIFSNQSTEAVPVFADLKPEEVTKLKAEMDMTTAALTRAYPPRSVQDLLASTNDYDAHTVDILAAAAQDKQQAALDTLGLFALGLFNGLHSKGYRPLTPEGIFGIAAAGIEWEDRNPL